MSKWVEHFVTDDVRILGWLTDRPRPGRPSLTYLVERSGQPDLGPFVTFDEALDAAISLAEEVAE